MKYPLDPAKYQYTRDYQIVELEGPAQLIQGGLNTYAFNFPFRFIAKELVCRAIVADDEVLAGGATTDIPEPAVLTQIKYHQTLLDNQPVALRAAWGTARNPAKLPIPWAVEQGTNVSVEAQIVTPFLGINVVPNVTMRLIFSIRGYQPSDDEFNAIRDRNKAIAVRPYQSFTFQPRNANGFVPGRVIGTAWDGGVLVPFDMDFPMDILVTKVVGEAFDCDNVDSPMTNPVDVPNPQVTLALQTKSANLFSTRDIFRNIAGTAEFPTLLAPNMQFKQGDTARAFMLNNDATLNPGQTAPANMAVFLTFIGYAPTVPQIRRNDIQRGRVKPETFDPQGMTGGMVKR